MSKDLISLIKDPSKYWKNSDPFNTDSFIHLEKRLRKSGFIYVGEGGSRLVYKTHKFSKYVVKIPRRERGWWANQEEVDFAKKYPQLVAKCRMFGMSSIMRELEIEGNADDDCPESHPLRILANKVSESQIDDGWQVGRHPETKQLLFYDFTRY
jgi:hypothetical protein